MTALIVLSLCAHALGFMLGVLWDRWSAHRRFMARLARDQIGARVRRAEARLDITPAIARSRRRQPIPLFPPGVK